MTPASTIFITLLMKYAAGQRKVCARRCEIDNEIATLRQAQGERLLNLCLHLQPPSMQQRLGVAVGLRQTFEYQIGGRLVRGRLGKVARHVLVQLVASVLFVHHACHALKGFGHLGFGDHAV